MTRIALAALLAAATLSTAALAQVVTPGGTSPGGNPQFRVEGGPGIPGTEAPPVIVPGVPVVVAPAPSAPRGNTRVGQLVCDASAGLGLIFGSSRSLDCEFRPIGGLPPERYVGRIGRLGIDVGYTGPATLVWTVVNTGPDAAPGSLAGRYVGVASAASLGLGLGSAALIGGSLDQVALQPLSIETNTGIAVAAGVAELSLQAAR